MSEALRDQLLESYRQCNEHLRASDTKRDQLLGFYFLFLTVFFANVGATRTAGLQPWFGLSLWVLGMLFAWLFHTFRQWHAVYVRTAIVLQKLIANDRAPTQANLGRIWPNTARRYAENLASVELWLFVAFLVATFSPLYTLVPQPLCLLPVNALYVLVGVALSRYLFDHANTQDAMTLSWMLRLGFDDETS